MIAEEQNILDSKDILFSLKNVNYKSGDTVIHNDGRIGIVLYFYEADDWRTVVQGPGITHSFGYNNDTEGDPCDQCGRWNELVEEWRLHTKAPMERVPQEFIFAIHTIDAFIYQEKFNEKEIVEWRKTLNRWQNKLGDK